VQLLAELFAGVVRLAAARPQAPHNGVGRQHERKLLLAEPPLLCYPEITVCRRAGSPDALGSKGFLSMTDSAIAVVLAAALSACVVVPAYGQTPTQTTETPTQTTQTPAQTTTTTPTETTTTPTETTPPPTSPEPTSAPNEYVESVPTGGGQSPAAPRQETESPAPADPAAATTTPATPNQSTQAAPSPRKAHKKKHRHAHQPPRRPDHAPARPSAQPAVPSTPAAADAGEPANPLLLGFALLLITASVLGTAVANRQGAGT